MTKLANIHFDDCVLDALRDDKLVVFAGAGVSMGPPSNLASFWQLASDIARSTGLAPAEPLDRFLGQLQHRGVAVHERAVQLLSPENSAPNSMHIDLLRLFRTVGCVRLVTTNFDLHFETAAESLYGTAPKIYRAPALPLGYDFTGIVHLHGALPCAQELVLTDRDFGRAYLTEGWARRFLVDVFRQYTVLFVGYSHNDVVMNYLARALPADGVAGRFALTDEEGNWDLLGIKPIRFVRSVGADTYRDLYDGVQRLAERSTRGALDWQIRLAEIGGREPPADEEAIGEVEQALREVHTTRFLIKVARDAEWPKWLSSRKHLDALFDLAELSERDQLLTYWLAEHFAIEHSDAIFDLIAAYRVRLNPVLWWAIGREIGVRKDKLLEESALKRWVSILLATAPSNADYHTLLGLAERCARQGLVSLTLKVFLFMGEHKLNITPGLIWPEEGDGERKSHLDVECQLNANHWSLNQVWTAHLKPHINLVAQIQLSGIAWRLEEMHQDLVTWDKASPYWDSISYGRSAIEPHEQDRYPKAVDVLIDAARDTLEWLATNMPVFADAWIERLITSDVPLLRRLAVHAMTVHHAKSTDERLRWVLARGCLQDFSVHHEVHRAIALGYVTASEEVRQIVVDAVLALTLPDSGDWPAEKRTARSHFNWLSWLLQSKPECPLAGAALEPIKGQYPEWRPSDHPDLTHWSGQAGWVGTQSPWTVEQLLARDPLEQIDDLLRFKESHFDGPDRDSLNGAVLEACKQNTKWAFALADALAEQAQWLSDLWPAVMRGLRESELPIEGWRDLLASVSRPELYSVHSYDIADLLYALVRDGGKPFALDLLAEANAIALPVWKGLEDHAHDDEGGDWLSHAINRPAGIIVEFWINSLSLLMHGKPDFERTLPENYRQWFTLVVANADSKGSLGRTLLASQTAFLFGLDEVWTRQHIIPLFSDEDRNKFAQAWDGFLVWGRLFPLLTEALLPAFVGAIPRIGIAHPDRRSRFFEFFTALAVLHVDDPTSELLPALFKHGIGEDRVHFASHLGYFLRDMQPSAKQRLWDLWLHRYWQDRLQSVPAALDEAEIRVMLDWLEHLGDLFPDAVSLVVRFPRIRLEHSSLLYELRESDLVTRYPTETAELVIYCCNCSVGYQVADIGNISRRLPELAPELRRRLDEGLALVGANG